MLTNFQFSHAADWAPGFFLSSGKFEIVSSKFKHWGRHLLRKESDTSGTLHVATTRDWLNINIALHSPPVKRNVKYASSSSSSSIVATQKRRCAPLLGYLYTYIGPDAAMWTISDSLRPYTQSCGVILSKRPFVLPLSTDYNISIGDLFPPQSKMTTSKDGTMA